MYLDNVQVMVYWQCIQYDSMILRLKLPSLK